MEPRVTPPPGTAAAPGDPARLRWAWRPSPARLHRRLRRYEPLPFTYREVGASGAATLPAGYLHIDDHTVVGTGQQTFTRLADALLHWDLQRRAGLLAATTDDTATIGTTVLNAAPGRPRLLVPCRVVDVVDEDRRRGFSYGTLPGHPLRGEERFTVELDDSGRVLLRIVSFSVPCGVAARVAPLARRGQRTVNRRYAAAACRIAKPGGTTPAAPIEAD